jgi:hypothetical protein
MVNKGVLAYTTLTVVFAVSLFSSSIETVESSSSSGINGRQLNQTSNTSLRDIADSNQTNLLADGNYNTNVNIINRLEEIHQSLDNITRTAKNESVSERQLMEESNRRLLSKLDEVRTTVDNFWSFRVSDVISLVLAALAGWLTIPPILVGTFYRPKLEVYIGRPGIHYGKDSTVEWSELNHPNIGIGITNKESRSFRIEIQINTDNFWPTKPRWRVHFPSGGLRGGYPLKGGFYVKSVSSELPGNAGVNFGFPLEANQQVHLLEIVIYPHVILSEFKLPRYLGVVDLNPIRTSFKIVQ